MEPVAAKSPRTGTRGPLRFFTTRIAGSRRSTEAVSLADMQAELRGLQRRLRSPTLSLLDAVSTTLQRLPLMLPAVARASANRLRGDVGSQPPG